MATIGTSRCGTHAETAFGEVEAVANRAANAVKLHPLQMRLIDTALVNQILDQPPDCIVCECGDNGRVHPKASFQAACDIVLTATFPYLKLTRRRDTPLARIEPQHHLAQTHNVPATARLLFSHKSHQKSLLNFRFLCAFLWLSFAHFCG